MYLSPARLDDDDDEDDGADDDDRARQKRQIFLHLVVRPFLVLANVVLFTGEVLRR